MAIDQNFTPVVFFNLEEENTALLLHLPIFLNFKLKIAVLK